MKSRNRAAFTLVELAVLVGVGTAVTGIAVVASQPTGGKPGTDPDGGAKQEGVPVAELGAQRAMARALKDAVKLREIHQAMIMWSQSNGDQFPLPSALDKNDDTVSLNGRAKDTTANILSLMIFNGSITPEHCISASEANANIKKDDRYEFVNPRAAIRSAKALWDPGFKVDFTKDQTANNSFALLQPSDGRLPRWSSTFIAVEPVISNRAPEISKVERSGDDAAGWKYGVTTAVKDSLTLLIHGGRDSWEGNIAYADGHVDLVTSLEPRARVADQEGLFYTTREDKKFLDCYFFDEEDDKNGSNAFLGIFATAGKSPKDFRGIWD